MDNDKGYFKKLNQNEVDIIYKEGRIDKVFYVGEKVKIKESNFKIRSIDFFSGIMTLKLLPREN